MTRKHYIFFARWCAHSNISEHRIQELCEYFQEDNPQFNKRTFMTAYQTNKQDYNEYNGDLDRRLFLQ